VTDPAVLVVRHDQLASDPRPAVAAILELAEIALPASARRDGSPVVDRAASAMTTLEARTGVWREFLTAEIAREFLHAHGGLYDTLGIAMPGELEDLPDGPTARGNWRHLLEGASSTPPA
jgi:hypothetical protein